MCAKKLGLVGALTFAFSSALGSDPEVNCSPETNWTKDQLVALTKRVDGFKGKSNGAADVDEITRYYLSRRLYFEKNPQPNGDLPYMGVFAGARTYDEVKARLKARYDINNDGYVAMEETTIRTKEGRLSIKPDDGNGDEVISCEDKIAQSLFNSGNL